ncbi:hypothetical protein F5B20DRAFT_192979 [Whalleya microplaca]|nr:hypothetical protein F5B20DRAFT_192979 [Whalleya microplaca]
MTYGEKPECSPDISPAVSAFKANFIPGGLIFNIHFHHYANDGMGWSSLVHQLAENCYAMMNQTPAPDWNPACIGHTRLIAKDIPDEAKVDGLSAPDRHKDHLPSSCILFHLPKSKAAELKLFATPDDGSWISTYDAFSALLWRILSKHRAALYKSDISSCPIWIEAINMRPKLNPPMPDRVQGNVMYVAASVNQTDQFTLAEVISEVPLSRLAAYIRKLTNSITEESLQPILEKAASVRDKTSLFIRVDSFPPTTICMTDWRETHICEADFGFGKPKGFRHLFDVVTEGLIIVYPPLASSKDSDEGFEIFVSLENQLIEQVKEDPEMKKYFEFRGFEVQTGDIPTNLVGKMF